jgi:hypothetical protein
MAGPSDNAYTPFACEEATVLDVNRQNWTCRVATTHSAKVLTDIQWAVPYHHYADGEGFHFMPEPGAKCYLATPNDGTPQFIMAFIAPPTQKSAKTDAPLRPEGTGEVNQDVSYQSKRPDLNPGDIAFNTRDGNFLILRRGGIVQLGATPLAQRVIVPVRNFIHDYCENYELATPAGDVTWTIDRPELDTTGQPACSWTFHMREFATDKSATVRVRHLALAGAGAQKAAWEVHIAPNGIDTRTESVSSAVYSMLVLIDGTKTELIGANRSIQVKGDDTLTVDGDQTTKVGGAAKLKAKSITSEASATNAVVGAAVKLGDANAMSAGVLGDQLISWLGTAQVITPQGAPGTPATGLISPASLAQLSKILSKKVFLK